jgi:hypothetical protein
MTFKETIGYFFPLECVAKCRITGKRAFGEPADTMLGCILFRSEAKGSFLAEPFGRNCQTLEDEMTRNVGDRYACEKCGATLIYEKPCACLPEMPHSEICCGVQMKAAGKK